LVDWVDLEFERGEDAHDFVGWDFDTQDAIGVGQVELDRL